MRWTFLKMNSLLEVRLSPRLFWALLTITANAHSRGFPAREATVASITWQRQSIPSGAGGINIGGEDETKYLGFQDFSTRDTATGGAPVGSPPGRPFTEGLVSRCASDICLRDSPITAEIRKEISRLARPGCRLTVAQSRIVDTDSNRPFLLSLGVVTEDVFIFDNAAADKLDHEVLVITMRGDGRYVETSSSRIFPPGRVVRVGRNAQVFD